MVNPLPAFYVTALQGEVKYGRINPGVVWAEGENFERVGYTLREDLPQAMQQSMQEAMQADAGQSIFVVHKPDAQKPFVHVSKLSRDARPDADRDTDGTPPSP